MGSEPFALVSVDDPTARNADVAITTDVAFLRATGVISGSVGVITVGGNGPADVSLPEDATPRELRLTCHLLAKLTKIRRRSERDRRRINVLQQLAQSDPLTGLLNRRSWESRCQQWAQGSQYVKAGVAVFDLDQFKKVNRDHGYPVGDDVLKAFARGLSNCMVNGDLLWRIGGDEFIAVIHNVDADTVPEVIDRLRVEASESVHRQGLPSVSASAGVSAEDMIVESDVPGLFEKADAALRGAKQSGRDQTVYGP